MGYNCNSLNAIPESKVNFVTALDISSRTYLYIAKFKGKDVIIKSIRRSKFIQIVENPQVNLNDNIH